MTHHGTHSARSRALAAALCALLLLVALGILDANGAPWWALVATQGALLVTAASAGMWLDRAADERREARGARGPAGSFRYTVSGATRGGPVEQEFWQERGWAEAEEEDHRR